MISSIKQKVLSKEEDLRHRKNTSAVFFLSRFFLISSGKVLKSFVLCAIILCTWTCLLWAMPSYNDVLVVVKQGDAESAAAAAYFKEQRQIPDKNILTLPLAGSVPTVAARDAFVAAIKKYLNDQGLTNTINYIVLSSNFPRECVDSGGVTSATNSIFDTYLIWALSDTYPSKDLNTSIPLRNNTYFYLRSANYNNRENIKFSKTKYKYYIVSRLDGPGLETTKKLIDNSGPVAYEQYKGGINFLVDEIPYMYWAFKYDVAYAELKKRGVNMINWDSSFSGTVHNQKDLNFAYLDWVSSGTADSFINYRNVSKHMNFRPGAPVFCYRSYPARVFKRPYGGLATYTLNGGAVQSFRKTDASDLLYRHVGDLAYVSESDSVWTALGQDPLKMYSSPRASSANNYRGNGVAVFTKDGAVINHFTYENTQGGLLSDAVYRVVYDSYNHKVWIGTFKGVCAYNLANNTWEKPAGLFRDKPAPVLNLYLDPTTNGKYLYITYSVAKTGVTPDITDYRAVLEYEISTGNIKRYKFHGANADMFNASIVKTNPNILWAVYWCGLTKRALVSKFDTATSQLLQTIDLATVDGKSYIPNDTGNLFAYQAASSKVSGIDNIFITLRNETAPYFNGVLRIIDSGSMPQLTVWGHTNDAYLENIRPARLLIQSDNPSTVYCLMTDRYDTSASSRIYRFSPTETTGKLLTINNGTSAISGGITSFAMNTNSSKIYYGLAYTGASHEPVVDFFPFGAVAGTGGFNHNSYTYLGMTDWQFQRKLDDLVPATASSEAERDLSIYPKNGYLGTPSVAFGMCLHLLHGFNLGESRMGAIAGYPADAGGGHTGHMFVFEPKVAPYAPRVDEDNTIYEIADRRTLKVRIFSPGFSSDWDNSNSAEGGFLTSTINTNTVILKDNLGTVVPTESITYEERNLNGKRIYEIIIRSKDNLSLASSYQLTLKCGINGIKNKKGAALTNTRPNEFKEEIALMYRTLSAEGVVPSVISAPHGTTVNEGESAKFRITATGSGPLAYQWKLNGAIIQGMSGPFCAIDPTTANQNGSSITVVVSNSYGTVTSDPAILTVLPSKPVIKEHPKGCVIDSGQTASFFVDVRGSGPFSYQWYKDSVKINGATSSNYSTPAVTSSDNGALFSVSVSNHLGMVMSSEAPLEVLSSPRIINQPASLTIPEGNYATFSVYASTGSSSPLLNYRWRRNGVNIAGANAASYRINNATAADNGAKFSVVVSNAIGSTTSHEATLTVLGLPKIMEQPVTQTVQPGQKATFRVIVSGANMTYLWYRDNVYTPISTTDTCEISSASVLDNGSYFYAKVSNGQSTTTSTRAYLLVVPPFTILGDFSGDGKITALDAAVANKIALRDTLAATSDELKRADMNADKKIDRSDAQLIAKRAVGLT